MSPDCVFSQKLLFLVIASLQKVKQWTADEVTQTPNYENVAKVEIKMKKVLKQKGEMLTYFTILYFFIHREKCIENLCMQ